MGLFSLQSVEVVPYILHQGLHTRRRSQCQHDEAQDLDLQ